MKGSYMLYYGGKIVPFKVVIMGDDSNLKLVFLIGVWLLEISQAFNLYMHFLTHHSSTLSLTSPIFSLKTGDGNHIKGQRINISSQNIISMIQKSFKKWNYKYVCIKPLVWWRGFLLYHLWTSFDRLDQNNNPDPYSLSPSPALLLLTMTDSPSDSVELLFPSDHRIQRFIFIFKT